MDFSSSSCQPQKSPSIISNDSSLKQPLMSFRNPTLSYYARTYLKSEHTKTNHLKKCGKEEKRDVLWHQNFLSNLDLRVCVCQYIKKKSLRKNDFPSKILCSACHSSIKAKCSHFSDKVSKIYLPCTFSEKIS